MGKKIILYTSDTCKRCDIIKMFLKEYNISYTEITDKQIMIDKEIEAVPVLECEGKFIRYECILEWLDNNGYKVRENSND